MTKEMRHASGIMAEEEILFSTPFDYFFPDAARSAECLLEPTPETIEALKALGDLMGDTAVIADPQKRLDSATPAIFTYFGQFIDHDLTARTDRDGGVTGISDRMDANPVHPDIAVKSLRNGRRPTLDLDSMFGDGPALVNGVKSQSQSLYDNNFKLLVFNQGGRRDLPREKTTNKKGHTIYRAKIADMRNDENVIISQLHTAFLLFYNAIYDVQAQVSSAEKYLRARRLTHWCYQYAVVEDYLKAVCDENIVDDILYNGPRYIGVSAGRSGTFMPLEFSVAAFRFGHSMIRPFYWLNRQVPQINLLEILGTAGKLTNFPDPGSGDLHPHQLRPERMIEWDGFVAGAGIQNHARKIDAFIAQGLFSLDAEGRKFDSVLKHLASSNLLRGFNLSIPTGQAVSHAFGIDRLTSAQLCGSENEALINLLERTGLDHQTPLWFYLLREAALQKKGERLGEVGGRLVCETIINLLKQDPNSYLNNTHHPAVRIGAQGNVTSIELTDGTRIQSLEDILRFANVL